MLGENGTEQFTVDTLQDGKLIRSQPIHDPFIHSTTTIGISRWDLFKALFRKQFETKIQVVVSGTPGVQRAIMMLDPEKLEAETKQMLSDRAQSRTENTANNHCFVAGEPNDSH
jgi:hypothetical protein